MRPKSLGQLRFLAAGGLVALYCSGCVAVPGSASFDTVQSAQLAHVDARPDFTVRRGDEYELTVVRLGVPVPRFAQTLVVAPDGKLSLAATEGFIDTTDMTIPEVENAIKEAYQPLFGEDVPVDVSLALVRSDRVVWLPDEILVLGVARRPRPVAYRKGMTVVRAIVAAAGMRYEAEPRRVVLLRRDDQDRTVTREIDVLGILEHEGGDDMEVFPGDIVYVPLSSIGFANLWVDQFIRNMVFISPSVILRIFLFTN